VRDLRDKNLEQLSNAIVEVHTLKQLFFVQLHSYIAVMQQSHLDTVGARGRRTLRPAA
jgi:hypothetical protein